MTSARIWSVASGKGGVGKTFVASSLGISLSRLNQRTLLVDLDMSGPNLHTAVGEKFGGKNLDAYFSGEAVIGELITPTKFSNLLLIQGSAFPHQLSTKELGQLVSDCRRLPFNEVIFDLGPGVSESYLELLRLSDERVLVVSPDPQAIEKNYRLVENVLLHTIAQAATEGQSPTLKSLLQSFRSCHRPGENTFRNHIKTEVEWVREKAKDIFDFSLRLIVNQCRGDKDLEIGPGIQMVCKHYFDVEVEYCGALSYDNAVWQSARTLEPTLFKYPFSPLAGEFHSMARKFLQTDLHSHSVRLVV